MEQPGSVCLWFENGPHALGRERRERRIINHHRKMEYTAHRLVAGFNFSKKSLYVARRTDIRGHDAHFHSAILQLRDEFSGFWIRSTASAREHEMARTGVDQPASQHLAVSPESAGDEIGSVRLYVEARGG
jgi:hypothetical protein